MPRHYFLIFINQPSRQPEVGEMGVQGLGEDKKNISPEIQAFPTTRPLCTGDGVTPAGDAVVSSAKTDLCPSKRGVPVHEFYMACQNTQDSTHYYIQKLINITTRLQRFAKKV